MSNIKKKYEIMEVQTAAILDTAHLLCEVLM